MSRFGAGATPEQQTAAEPWAHGYRTAAGVRLHLVETGDGPPVILLHGFPEFWYSWHHQLPALAAAGFHALAPDMRGYNLSEKPGGVGSYRLELLTGDVAALIRSLGVERAHVVGHDWGGVVAWDLAHSHPAAVDRLVILNAPHPSAYLRELRGGEQLRKSSYVYFFQLPWVPEATIRRDDFALLGRMLRRDPVRPGAFSEADIQRYKAAAAQPGALTAAINYYRAAARQAPWWALRKLRPIERPTLLIWGKQDRYLSEGLTRNLDAWVRNLRVEHLADASHWVQNDAPETVNKLIVDFLSRE